MRDSHNMYFRNIQGMGDSGWPSGACVDYFVVWIETDNGIGASRHCMYSLSNLQRTFKIFKSSLQLSCAMLLLSINCAHFRLRLRCIWKVWKQFLNHYRPLSRAYVRSITKKEKRKPDSLLRSRVMMGY